MSTFIVVENDNGLMVTEVSENESNADAAARHAAVIVDEGPYHSHEDAYDAMQLMPDNEREQSSRRE